ncbi:MAG: Tim44 domain-containing protein [Ramlibacter sp.]|nr:Tim44 domain-containing protein [Ramlibacter sp.]MBX3657288.1 Tim44 domain-containing protein [Ramlibacter sp.]
MRLLTLLLAGALVLASVQADAKRLGGGKSIGRQSGNVTQRESVSPAPAAPVQNATNSAARPATAGAAPAPRKPWSGLLGGLAAGLGLAWLAHALGFGEAFGQFMLVALLAFVAIAALSFLMRSRRPPAVARPYAFQGASSAAQATAPPQYSPDKVGNDASARPWERSSMAFDASKYAASGSSAAGVQIGSALAGPQGWGIPAGFDAEGFLAAAKRNFVTLQDAWDRADIGTLRSMMTDAMVGEISTQLAEREHHIGSQVNKTEVVMLEAQLLGIEDLGDDYMASVEFSGMIREDPSAGPSPFREVWNMTKPRSGSSGWLVGGVQALQ